MRAYVTGANGFVGRWLVDELRDHGHEVVLAPDADSLDIADHASLVRWFSGRPGPPDAVAHLAGIAFAPNAARNPVEAFRVNVGGTVAVFEALREIGIRPVVLVTGSSEVYGYPRPEDLPLSESTPIRPNRPYALSKSGQEGISVEMSARHGFPVIVTRSFNHTGPGQRPPFVVPALAHRILAMRDGRTNAVAVGNIDVWRDLTDVRDVVRAYRLLIEASAAGSNPAVCTVVNVGSGRAIPIRRLVEQLCDITGVAPNIEIDPALVRSDDPPEIRADVSLLRSLIDWQPRIAIDRTLADVLAFIQAA